MEYFLIFIILSGILADKVHDRIIYRTFEAPPVRVMFPKYHLKIFLLNSISISSCNNSFVQISGQKKTSYFRIYINELVSVYAYHSTCAQHYGSRFSKTTGAYIYYSGRILASEIKAVLSFDCKDLIMLRAQLIQFKVSSPKTQFKEKT